MKILFLTTCILLAGCSAVHKSQSFSSASGSHIDTSSLRSQYSRETTITEQASMQVTTRPDTASFTAYMVLGDTCFALDTETAGIRLKTTITERRDPAGKPTGYNVRSTAITKPQEVQAPVNKTTHIIEAGEELARTGISATEETTTKTSNKQVKRFNLNGAVAAIGCVGVVAFLYFLFIHFKRKK